MTHQTYVERETKKENDLRLIHFNENETENYTEKVAMDVSETNGLPAYLPVPL